VTGDESWRFQFNPEMQRQSMEQHGTNSPLQKKVRLKKLRAKTMLDVFFDADIIMHSKFVHEGTAVNSQYYLGVMERLHACMRSVSSIATAGCCCMTTHPLTARWNMKQFLASKSVCVTQHHPYWPDMASAPFSLPKGETAPKWTVFQ
jgi:hypothetical protein